MLSTVELYVLPGLGRKVLLIAKTPPRIAAPPIRLKMSPGVASLLGEYLVAFETAAKIIVSLSAGALFFLAALPNLFSNSSSSKCFVISS